ncbi:MAG: SAM-dependent methyltransferase [Clostridia bacterium]|nr:SAM-dependent methyltransferase [Clostridia bacterium]
MGYGKRIDTLCSLLQKVKVFADVGCDHGYCTEYMLKNGLCEKAIFSDVSKGSLAKAQALLAPYVESGVAQSVLGDGFFGVPDSVNEVLIAGMGGSEIVEILSHKTYGFMPERFVFQPMRDSEKLRRYILENGGFIEQDFTFRDGKFYDVICGGRGSSTAPYSEMEYEFGRDNLAKMPNAFVERTQRLIRDIDRYSSQPQLSDESREELAKRKRKLQEVLKI